jgi:hypothetical protein
MLSVIQATVPRSCIAGMFPIAFRSTIIGRSYALSRLVPAILPFVALTVLATSWRNTTNPVTAASLRASQPNRRTVIRYSSRRHTSRAAWRVWQINALCKERFGC